MHTKSPLFVLLFLLLLATTGRFAIAAESPESAEALDPGGEMDQPASDAANGQDSLAEAIRNLFPNWLVESEFLRLPHYMWICLFVVILAGVILDRLIRSVLSRMMTGWLKLAKIEFDEKLQQSIWKPVGLLGMALVWYFGAEAIGLPDYVMKTLRVAVVAFAVLAGIWTAFRLIDLMSDYLMKKAELTKTKFDDLLIPLVSRSLKFFAVCIGLVMFAEGLDLPVSGLIGGLGIGGLAFALAAKDTLSNIFGSVTVLVDRPFEIGDWIKTGEVEGTVETVGIRSSRIRTFYNSLITLPNAMLTTAIVDNMGRRRYRRIKTTLALEYSTPPDRIEAFCEGIRELIRRHPYTRKDYYHVYLNQFSDSSLDVLLYCFVECPDWAMELRERQRLFIDILKLASELGVAFAFPTRTLHLHQQEAASGGAERSALGDPLRAGRDTAAIVTGKPFSRNERPGAVEFPSAFGGDDDAE